jgi:hypothetical protein
LEEEQFMIVSIGNEPYGMMLGSKAQLPNIENLIFYSK